MNYNDRWDYEFLNNNSVASLFSNSEIFSFQFNLYSVFMFRYYYKQMNIIIFIFIYIQLRKI